MARLTGRTPSDGTVVASSSPLLFMMRKTEKSLLPAFVTKTWVCVHATACDCAPLMAVSP